MKYETIIFDIDGTLYPPTLLKKYMTPLVVRHPFVCKTYSELRHEVRSRQDSFEYSNNTPESRDFYWREAAVLKDMSSRFKSVEAARAWLSDNYYSRLLKQFQEIGRQEDVVETLRFLKGRGVRLAFLSDWPLGDKLQRIGIDEFSAVAFTSEDTLYLKPSPRSVEWVVRKIGADPRSTLFIGDSYDKDVLGACAAGLDAALIHCRGASLADSAEATESWTQECFKSEKDENSPLYPSNKIPSSEQFENTGSVYKERDNKPNKIPNSVQYSNPPEVYRKYPKAKMIFPDWAGFDSWVKEAFASL